MIYVKIDFDTPDVPIVLKVNTLKVAGRTLEDAYADRRVAVDIAYLNDEALEVVADRWRDALYELARVRREALGEPEK